MDIGWAITREIIPNLLRTYGPEAVLSAIEQGNTPAFDPVWAQVGTIHMPQFAAVVQAGYRVGVMLLPFSPAPDGATMCAIAVRVGEQTGRYFLWCRGPDLGGGTVHASLCEFDGNEQQIYASIAMFNPGFDAETFVQAILRVVAPPKQAWLRHRTGPAKFEDYLLAPNAVIGRGPESTLQILDAHLSKTHCRVEWRDGNWVLVDAGSANGMKIRGERIKEHVLVHRDTIELGETSIAYLEYEDALPPPPAELPAALREDKWKALFLDDSELPNFKLTEDRRVPAAPPPDPAYVAAMGLRWGTSIWAGHEQWPIVRVADHRWLFGTPEQAEAYVKATLAAASENLPPMEPPQLGDWCARFGGADVDPIMGVSVTSYIHVLRIGPVVAKVHMTEGSGAPGTLSLEMLEVYIERVVRRARTSLIPL
jgi:hypothetical protein